MGQEQSKTNSTKSKDNVAVSEGYGRSQTAAAKTFLEKGPPCRKP